MKISGNHNQIKFRLQLFLSAIQSAISHGGTEIAYQATVEIIGSCSRGCCMIMGLIRGMYAHVFHICIWKVVITKRMETPVAEDYTANHCTSW